MPLHWQCDFTGMSAERQKKHAFLWGHADTARPTHSVNPVWSFITLQGYSLKKSSQRLQKCLVPLRLTVTVQKM